MENINIKQLKEDFFLFLFNNNFVDLKLFQLFNLLFEILMISQNNTRLLK